MHDKEIRRSTYGFIGKFFDHVQFFTVTNLKIHANMHSWTIYGIPLIKEGGYWLSGHEADINKIY